MKAPAKTPVCEMAGETEKERERERERERVLPITAEHKGDATANASWNQSRVGRSSVWLRQVSNCVRFQDRNGTEEDGWSEGGKKMSFDDEEIKFTRQTAESAISL